MDDMLIGYARCSTAEQDLTAQKEMLMRLGVKAEHIYTDGGMTGTNRARPGLQQAMAAVRRGETFVVTKLDRMGRSAADLRDIAEELQRRGVKLSIGGKVYDPADPMEKMIFGVFSLFAEFEADLIRMRTREGMAIAKAKGKLKGRAPALSPTQRQAVLDWHAAGRENISELAGSFKCSRATIYRVLADARKQDATAAGSG